MMKIDYSTENSKYVRRVVSSLKDDGIAYFILMGNLSGVSDKDSLAGFQNYRIGIIYDFLNKQAISS